MNSSFAVSAAATLLVIAGSVPLSAGGFCLDVGCFPAVDPCRIEGCTCSEITGECQCHYLCDENGNGWDDGWCNVSTDGDRLCGDLLEPVLLREAD